MGNALVPAGCPRSQAQSDRFNRLIGAVLEDWRLYVILVILICLTGCGGRQARFEPDTLRINIAAEPPSIDWSISTDSTSFDVIYNLMVGLTQYTRDLTCAPACAKSWEILNHGTVYRFHLRPDICWSDGKPLTAYDFEYAWKRLLNPKTGAQYAYYLYDIKNAEAYNRGAITDSAKLGINCPDAHTFVVELSKPAQYFIYLTAFCPSFPQRQDVVEKWGTHWTDPEHLVCNGAFTLAKWAHEYKIELTANPRYFGGKIPLHAIKMFMVPEQSTAFALYENDQLDFVDNRSFSTPDVQRYKHSPEYQNMALLRGNYLGFAVSKPPFDKVLVRQAFTEAIDRKVFPRILRRGEKPQYSWIPPGILGYDPSAGAQYDPENARKLLAQAGYPGGHGFPRVELLYPNREDTKLVVEEIQDQLKRNLNVEVALVNQEWRVYLETLHRDPSPLFRGSWGADYPDPETFMNLFTSNNGNNWPRFSDPYYDQLLDKARSETDVVLRGRLYAQADAYLCKVEVPIVTTYLSTQNAMVKPWVHGIKLDALDLQFFNNVRVGD
jgi:oligopeptide transport system substrate-binding protein